MSNSYSYLAKYYDKFIEEDCSDLPSSQSSELRKQDCDYVSWSQYLLRIAQSRGVKTAVDIACGTGKMTKLLVDYGLNVTAVDASAEMLNEAVNKCRATFVMQDMRKLQLLKKADMAVCVNDGVNYLKPSELVGFFKTVAANLAENAPFVFDVSGEYKLRNIIGNNVFFTDNDCETLLWTNTTGKTSVKMNLTLFIKRSDGAYDRFDESHTQYIHTRQSIERALDAAGFNVAEVTADYGKPIADSSRRITFYAIKRQ